jgi:eukaryotic-like serine/threonine-protein kinase
VVAEGEAEAARAMDWLRRAVAMGYQNTNELQIESAFVSLRSRRDFQLLTMDLAFPADPFVGADDRPDSHPTRLRPAPFAA